MPRPDFSSPPAQKPSLDPEQIEKNSKNSLKSNILFASLWEVRARKGLIVPAAGGEGGTRATNNTKITKIYKGKNFKSWKVKLLSKIQCFGNPFYSSQLKPARYWKKSY